MFLFFRSSTNPQTAIWCHSKTQNKMIHVIPNKTEVVPMPSLRGAISHMSWPRTLDFFPRESVNQQPWSIRASLVPAWILARFARVLPTTTMEVGFNYLCRSRKTILWILPLWLVPSFTYCRDERQMLMTKDRCMTWGVRHNTLVLYHHPDPSSSGLGTQCELQKWRK